jgi:hypothetical protein
MLRGMADDGFEMVREWLTAEHRGSLLKLLAAADGVASVSRGAGESYAARALHRSIPLLAQTLQHVGVESLAERFLDTPAVLLDATFFDKHATANWAVPSHQDRVVAAANADLKGARVRRGEVCCEPAAGFLGGLVALRLHFDRTDERTGALQLIRGSHLWGIVPDANLRQVTPSQFTMVDANPGDVLVMRPLTVHRSPSGSAPTHRRVLHVVCGDSHHARGLGWMPAAST